LYGCENKGVAVKGIRKLVILKAKRIHRRGHGEHGGSEEERMRAAGKRFSRLLIARK
jgi:hypothetical protein